MIKSTRSLLFLLVLVTNFAFICSSRTNTSLEEPTYSLLNDFFARTEVPCFCIKDTLIEDQFQAWNISKEDLNGLEKMDSIFSKDDVAYILEQFLNAKNDRIVKQKINSPNLVSLSEFGNKSRKKFWDNFVKVYHQNTYSTVSRPLFSKDKQKAIISTLTHSRESFSWGAVFVFVKKNNIWTPTVQWMMMVG